MGDLTSDIIILSHGKCKPKEKICVCRNPGGFVVAIAGWLTRQEFVRLMTTRDLGLGVRYICECKQLNPMHKIWELPSA